MKKILITNDDGIGAGGIVRLAEAAKAFGEVYVVAPVHQRSAASHCITLHEPFDVRPYDFPVEGVHAWSCSGTPGDCVRIGCLNMVPGGPDAVLTGINHGTNVASDIQYSATAGAAFEASFQGHLAIALSEKTGPCHEAADAYVHRVLELLLERPALPGQIYNVNFPACPAAECRGILEDRTVSRGTPFIDTYDAVELLPDGGTRFLVHGTRSEEAEEGSDFRAVLDGYVSVGLVNNVGYGIISYP